MASFQGKIGWKRLRKGENKNYRSVLFRSYMTRNRKFEKKWQKNLKIPFWLHFKAIQAGKGREREKINIIVPFRSNTARNRKFQKYHYGFISRQNRLEKAEEERKQKIIVPFRSYTTRSRKFEKNGKKIKKIKKYHYGFISKQYRLGKAEKERK